MDPNMWLYITGAGALIAGLVAGKVVFSGSSRKKMEETDLKVQNLIKEAELRAETIRKEKELEAKERFVQLKSAHEKEVNERNRKISESENRIRQREQSINQKESGLEKQVKENESIKENLKRQIEVVNLKRTELEKHQEEHIRRLEKIAGLSAEEAKSQLVETLKQEAQSQAIAVQQEIIDEAKQKANKEIGRAHV